MSGFVVTPPPVLGERFPTEEAAWEFYRWGNNSKRYGMPMKIGESGWICPLPQPIVNAELAAEACEALGQTSAPPSPGSSIERAKLKPEDQVRIAHEAARKAQKRRQQQQAIEAEERRRLAQPNFDLDGDAS